MDAIGVRYAFDVRPASSFNINSCGFPDGNIQMFQPRFVKRIAPQTMYIGALSIGPYWLEMWYCCHLPDGELPAALLPHLSGSATLLIGRDNLDIACFA